MFITDNRVRNTMAWPKPLGYTLTYLNNGDVLWANERTQQLALNPLFQHGFQFKAGDAVFNRVLLLGMGDQHNLRQSAAIHSLTTH